MMTTVVKCLALGVLLVSLTAPSRALCRMNCVGLELRPAHRGMSEELQEHVFQLLLERVGYAGAKAKSSNSLGISMERGVFLMEAPGMSCESARRLASSRIVEQTPIELKFKGEEVLFEAEDFESHIKRDSGRVVLKLRAGPARRFYDMSKENIGKTISLKVGDIVTRLDVRAAQTSGVIVLDESQIPAGAFYGGIILPLTLTVGSCGECVGEYE